LVPPTGESKFRLAIGVRLVVLVPKATLSGVPEVELEMERWYPRHR